MDVNSEYLTIKSGVVVPALQSLVSGVFYGVATSGVVAVANSMNVLDVPAWACGCVVGALTGIYAWQGLLKDWRVLLYGLDPEPISEPETVIMPPVRVELSQNDGRSMQFIDLPAEPDQMIQLGAGIAEGLSFTESQWTGAGAPFSRAQFVQLRGEMIRRGLLAWNSQNDNARGVRVTGKGGALMRHFASLSHNPPTLTKRR